MAADTLLVRPAKPSSTHGGAVCGSEDYVEITFPSHPPLKRFRLAHGCFDCACGLRFRDAQECHRHISIECSRYEKYRSTPADDAARRRAPPSTKAQTRRAPPPKRNALFVPPPQGRTREVVRPHHARSPFARADAPPAGESSSSGAAVQNESMDVPMDMSVDVPVNSALPARHPTPAETSTRDATPALSFASSDTETESALPDEGSDWARIAEPEAPQMLFYASSQDALPDVLKTPPLAPSLMPDHLLDAVPALSWELQYPEEHSNPIRRFLDGLRRPVGHRFAAFYVVGIRSQDDLQALAGMPQEWDTIKVEC